MSENMRTITGLFDTYEHAAIAVRALKDAGIPSEDISIVANNAQGKLETHHDEGGGAATGAGLGAATGGGIGLLAGLGALAIPGVGPVVAAGWLLSTAAGAAIGLAAGSIVGALLKAGISEEDAHVYAEGIRRGGSLVSVRVPDERADAANAILANSRGVDIAKRRTEYAAEGWESFDETQTEVYRSTSPVVPLPIR